MRRSNRMRVVGSLVLLALAGCDGCGDGDAVACTVGEVEGGVVFTCGATDATIPTDPCSFEETQDGILVTCSDGTSTIIPRQDAGSDSCTVKENADGSVTISCPDGSEATIPAPGGQDGGLDGGSDATVVNLVGAMSTACGACHDTDTDKTHFATMTTIANGKPSEGCPSCHQESGLRSVSAAHARLEFGPPGFNVQILGASIDPDGGRVTVNLRIQDEAGAPLSRTGVSSNFMIATVSPELPAGGSTPVAGPYVNYFTRPTTQVDYPDFPLDGTPRVVQQPFAENNGTYSDGGGPGLFNYTFSGTLPSGYDGGVTHVVTHYSTRTVGETRWVSNGAYFWVPADPSAAPLRRKVVQTATCNKCHNPLAEHGTSGRQQIDICLSCHSQGSSDPETGNSIDLNVMIHRIHMGARLPSVQNGTPYVIAGRNGSPADFSHVNYPQDIVHCQSCHTSADDDSWYTNGKTAVCTACHDDIYEPGKHVGSLSPTAVCGNGACHGPGGSAPPANTAHSTYLNSDAPIFDISIVSATVSGPDAAPALRVKAMRGTRLSGATTPVTSVDNFSMLNVFFNGPNSDYSLHYYNRKQYNKADLVNLVATSTPGEFTFSLPQTLREAAGTTKGDPTKDSFTVAIRAAYDPTPSGAPDNDRVDMLKNPTAALSAAGSAVARPAVVETSKCNNCHGDLRAHGGDILARNVEECVMCHGYTFDTSVRQGANKEPGPTSSIRFSQLIHRIHAGGMATEPYVIYGFANMAPFPRLDFSNLGFPGDRKDCLSCHAAGTFLLPPKASPNPTETHVLDESGQPIKQ